MTAERIGRKAAIIAACGAALGLGGAAAGQTVLNISGATLLENFLKAPASTNDYFDVDGNGVARRFGTNQQLAPFSLPPIGPPSQWWIVQYRAVGSGNGFQELIDFGRVFVSTEDNVEIFSTKASKAFHNRVQYVAEGRESNEIFNAGNPGGAPVRTLTDGSYRATYSNPDIPSAGGVQIDISPLDVPTNWAAFFDQNGTPRFDRLPGTPGYGLNARRSTNKQGGSEGADLDNHLADLNDLNLFDPANPGNANDRTLFDTPIAYAPICPVVNLGVGMEQIDQSALRHFFTTGRLPTGENLMAVTRDVGSGTRNGFNNSLCLDPSWGVGENIGDKSAFAEEQVLGPKFIPGNKAGNGEVERTSGNHRLAIGYAGAERGVNSGWLTGGRLEILAVRHDLQGGTTYRRPTIGNLLKNSSAESFRIGGPAVLATIGDPRAEPPSNGGIDNGLPRVRNRQAAGYINNITLSTAAFIGDPGGDQTLFTPGEFLATNFLLTAALDYVPNPVEPCDWIANAAFNQAVQDFALANNVLRNPLYEQFGQVTRDGKVPTRLTGVVYSDGVANGDHYVDQAGNPAFYGENLKRRNRIAGDFSGDGRRDIADAAEMIKAWRHRNGGPTWVAPGGTGQIDGAPGSDAVIEILGDFNGDGSFDREDVRYWAGGLAMVGGRLDRAAGYAAVDDAAGSNFFGVTLATGAPYNPGDSRGDVSSPGANHTRGFAPIGFDGVVGCADIDYVYAQFKRNPAVTDGRATWSDTFEAATFDLEADMNGDLVVDQADVDTLVRDILKTPYGDVNLDRRVDGTDRAIIVGNLGKPGGWCDGDLNGDGVVDEGDLRMLCYADCNGDGRLDIRDFFCFQAAFASQELYADCNGDGRFDIRDFFCFQSQYAAGCQ